MYEKSLKNSTKKEKKKEREEFEEETDNRLYMLKGIVHIGFSFS